MTHIDEVEAAAGFESERYAQPDKVEIKELQELERTVQGNLQLASDRLMQYASHYPPILSAARRLLTSRPRHWEGEHSDPFYEKACKQPDEAFAHRVTACAAAVESGVYWLDIIGKRMSGDPKEEPIIPWHMHDYRLEMERLPPPIEPLPERTAAQRAAGGMMLLGDIAAVFQPPAWVVDGLLPAGGFSLPYGGTGHGKTTLFAGIEWSVATGAPWHGRATLPGCVLHVAAEDPGGVVARLRALQVRHGNENAPIGVLPYAIDLTDRAGTDALAAEARRLQIATLRPCRLICVDTLAKSVGSSDEDSNAAMETLCANVARVTAEIGCHVAILAHPGKDALKGPRGASCLPAAADTVIRIDRGRAVVTKQRNGPDGDVFGFRLASVTIGTAADGRAITAALAEPEEAKPARRPGKAEAAEPESDPAADADRMPAILAEAVRAAAEAGAAFKLNNAGSLFARRSELPQPLADLPRAALANVAKVAISDGLIVNAGGILTAPALP